MTLIDMPPSGAVIDLADHRSVAAILDLHPLLSWRGWWSAHHEASEPAGTLARVRRETLDEYGLAQFRRAMTFLEVAPRTKGINLRRGCYAWKHCVERWHRSSGTPYRDTYCGEGSFIAACVASGMPIKLTAGGTFTALSDRAWAMGDRLR
jgi:hypothetical protein